MATKFAYWAMMMVCLWTAGRPIWAGETPAKAPAEEGAAEEDAVPIPSESPGEMLGRYLALKRVEQKRLAKGLGQLGDPAAEAIMDFYFRERLTDRTAVPLVEALGEIDTETAFDGLRSILGSSYLMVADLEEPWKVLRRLAMGRDEEADGPVRHLWQRLAVSMRERIQTLLAQGDDAELEAEDKLRLVSALNDLLEDRYFYDKEQMGELPLAADARALAPKHQPEATRIGVGLSPLEMVRLNRAILEAVCGDALRSGPRVDVRYRYSDAQVVAALKAMSTMSVPQAQDFLLSYRPLGERARRGHIEALRLIREPARVHILGRYLLSIYRSVSARALDIMRRDHILKSPAAEAVLTEMLEKVDRERHNPYPKHAVEAVLRAILGLEDAQRAARLFARALESNREPLRHATIGVLRLRPDLLPLGGVTPVLMEALPHQIPLPPTESVAGKKPASPFNDQAAFLLLLEAVRKNKTTGALPFVAYCLDSVYFEVRMQACDTMKVLTGKDLGRKAGAWRDWYRQQQ